MTNCFRLQFIELLNEENSWNQYLRSGQHTELPFEIEWWQPSAEIEEFENILKDVDKTFRNAYLVGKRNESKLTGATENTIQIDTLTRMKVNISG